MLENPPAHGPQANDGDAERAVQEVKAQMRAIALALEARVKSKLDNRCAIMEWIIPHAAAVINRFLIGRDGRTAHYRIHEKTFHGKVIEFGEQILAKPMRNKKTQRKIH